MPNKSYLGDAVYAEWDENDYHLILTTEDGTHVTNRIYLEPEVIEKLIKYINRRKND